MASLLRGLVTTARKHVAKVLALLIFTGGIAGGVGLYVGADGYYVQATAAKPAAPALTVAAQPMYADDQGRTMATDDRHPPSQQILRKMSQPGAAGSPTFLQEIQSDGGVDVEASIIQLIISSHSSGGVWIRNIRLVALHRTAPLDGTLYFMPPQGAAVATGMMFDLDELNPLARQIAISATPGSGNPKQQLTFSSGIQPGKPFFNASTIDLADNAQQVLTIRVQVTHFYATFRLEIDYITSGGVLHRVIVSDRGHPFSVTGLSPGPAPKTFAYQQAFRLQGNFSLCQIANPGRIPLTAIAPPPRCR